MLWYRSWLDTRWRFLIGFALLLFSACGTVVAYVELGNLLSTLDTPAIEGSGTLGAAIGEAIEEAIELQRTYRGFVWSQWFDKNLTFLGTFFAALLGSGSPFSGAGRGLLFSLALPVSRGRWLGARAGTGLAELLVLAVIPSLAVPLLSPLIGEHYSVGDAVVHGAYLFVVAAMFFSLALLLSTVFNDVWRPLLLTCLVAMGLSLGELALRADGLFTLMSAEAYFRGGSLPWVGLLISVALTAALLYAAAAQVARRDF